MGKIGVKNTFDYIFYRVYSLYKRKRDSTPLYMAGLVLVVLTTVSLLAAYSLTSFIVGFEAGQHLQIVCFALLIAGTIPVYSRYRKEALLLELEKRYEVEKIGTKRRRGIVIVFWIIVAIGIPVLIGTLRHRLGIFDLHALQKNF